MVEALAPLAREARAHEVANADGAAKQAMPANVSDAGEIKKEKKKKGKKEKIRFLWFLLLARDRSRRRMRSRKVCKKKKR